MEELQLQSDTRRERTYKEIADIHLADFNILPQPRTEFEEDKLMALAKNIYRVTLIHPVSAANYSEKKARKHLNYLNKLWGKSLEFDDVVTPLADGRYLILLAGERRYRATKLLVDASCDYEPFIETQVYYEPDPVMAFNIQFAENTSVPIDPQREADAYAYLYRLNQLIGRNISKAEFADEMSRDTSTIRKALRYNDLPEKVRDLVFEGHIKYGHATELARLQERGMSEEELMVRAGRIIAADTSVSKFREIVSARIAELEDNQSQLFDMDPAAQKQQTKKIAGQKLIEGKWKIEAYFSNLLAAIEKGLLGTPEAQYSPYSPARQSGQTLMSMVAIILDELGVDALSKERYRDFKLQLEALKKTLKEKSSE